MNDERMDLTPLDPARDPDRYERLVGAVTDAAAMELARRRLRTTAIGQVARWYRPMLAAAAAIAIAAVTVLTQVDSGETGESDAGYADLAVALGFPQGFANLIDAEAPPTTADLLESTVEGSR